MVLFKYIKEKENLGNPVIFRYRGFSQTTTETKKRNCWGFYCLTHVSPPGFDDYGSAAARLLLGLGHALPGLLVRVVCGTHRNFILDASQAVQLYVPFTEETRGAA